MHFFILPVNINCFNFVFYFLSLCFVGLIRISAKKMDIQCKSNEVTIVRITFNVYLKKKHVEERGFYSVFLKSMGSNL